MTWALTKGIAKCKNCLLSSRILGVTDFCSICLFSKFKLSDLANLAGISQFHFSRLFKNSMGISPHKYVIKQRVERAKSLLKNPELSVTEISLLCGFNSHSHLGKYFRQLTGFTPRQYRASTASRK
ncbi:AraC family transcriptional regulator [Rivularia sp. PCC 7116]|uniref:helix-turn-helix domain-containing protein n=1 Tax=Rivularia sp. PCC 7116 TaxID=373994 RepID=UPI0009FD5712|nr:helix-turn-helix transcriptional regulator [Rivularia sp. PCC 7116]